MPPASPEKKSSSQVAKVRFCPRCFRTDPELGVEFCGNFALGCPEPQLADSSQAITVSCVPCGKTRTIPVGSIMQRKRLDELGRCVSDRCQARVIS